MKQDIMTLNERQKYIIETNKGNVHRMRTILLAMGIFQLLQTIFYLIGTDRTVFDYQLISIKLLIIGVLTLNLFLFHRYKKPNSFLPQHSEGFLTYIIASLLAIALINTFKAQSITSDISIFTLSVFAISAAIRKRTVVMGSIYLVNYIALVVGLPFFQSNASYVTSHIVNGAIISILAFLISNMFYRYSLQDFLDKRQLIFLSKRDSLTGLLNHKTIHEELEMLIQSQSTTDNKLYVALLDLDRFKDINDTYGHKFGDEVLLQASESITSITTENIIAGRYGGDEFMILFNNTDSEQVITSLKCLLNTIGTIDISNSKLTYSCGVATYTDQTTDQLVELADQRMYMAKAKGRNQIVSNSNDSKS